MNRETVIILDFDGHNNQATARLTRGMGIYCEILPYSSSPEQLKQKAPAAIICTGSPDGSGAVDTGFIELGIPVLGIGYGAGLLKSKAAGRVTEYGGAVILGGFPITKKAGGAPALADILRVFLFDAAKLSGDWTMKRFADDMVVSLKQKIGGRKVLCAMSGGVDSAVAATLVHRAAGERLSCILVDHGLMRKYEVEQVLKVFRDGLGMNLRVIDASDRFLKKLSGITDPEQKRKLIGTEFIRVFEDIANELGAVDFLVQGTIYPDIVESGFGSAALVKSHHNVGGLPSVIDFEEIIEPLKDLFKDEVRALGFELGLDESIVMRQPFPGPGLGIRIIGEVTRQKLDILRDADYILREEIALAGLNKEIWQYFAVLTDLQSVGVKDGKRTYEHTLGLRAITSVDAMTADFYRIPYDILAKISSRITSEVKGINRVVYDITPKPPATIEWE